MSDDGSIAQDETIECSTSEEQPNVSSLNLRITKWINEETEPLTDDSIITNSGKENMSPFVQTLSDPTINIMPTENDQQIQCSKNLLIEQMKTSLLSLTGMEELTEFNDIISEEFLNKCLESSQTHYRAVLQEIKDLLNEKQQLQASLTKINQNGIDTHQSVFAESNIHNKEDKISTDNQQFSHFTMQLITSLLIVSIRANETFNPTISTQIITLTSQLCEQIPIKDLHPVEPSSNGNNLIFKSIRPLIDYISELSLSIDTTLSTKALQVLLKLSLAQTSFKDLLPLISKLVFDTVNTYDVRSLFVSMNNCLDETIKQYKEKCSSATSPQTDKEKSSDQEHSFISLDYLKSNGVFPNAQLSSIDENKFTGEFISSVLLSHIDIYNEMNSNKTIHSSIAFEFQPSTFRQLFSIIEKLTADATHRLNSTLNQIVIVCTKLFEKHLYHLSVLKSNVSKKLMAKINEVYKNPPDTTNIDLSKFVTNEELSKWFELLLRLACEENENEPTTLARIASKALTYILDLRMESFVDQLLLMHKYIIENRYKALVESFCIKISRNETILNWIEILLEKDETLPMLYSFIDVSMSLDNALDQNYKEGVQQIIRQFQRNILHRFIKPTILEQAKESSAEQINKIECEKSAVDTAALLFGRYISHIIVNHLSKGVKANEVIDQVFLDLSLLTETETVNTNMVCSLFHLVIPLLADTLARKELTKQEAFYWLFVKIAHLLVIGEPLNYLETKFADKLKSPLFIGGCENSVIEQSEYLSSLRDANVNFSFSQTEDSPSDHQFLMSIFNNTDEGAKLISKMKRYSKIRHQLLKSIEKQATQASSALFAVYIKHYRRINLARAELLASDDKRPHSKLLSLYEYANQIETLFTNAKAQGVDCNELFENILKRTSFLLLGVKENDFIPIIQDDPSQPVTSTESIAITQPKRGVVLRRRSSQWTKAKHVFTILRHALQACIRFKRLMLARKQAIAQNQDNESILHKEIHNFISAKSEDTQLELNELRQCLIKQHERATIRLFTYRLVYSIVEKLVKLEDKQRVSKILRIVLGYTRGWNSNWFYLEHVQATNDQLKQEIRNAYYSIVKVVLSFLIESKLFERSLFSLLSLSYKPADIHHIHDHELIEPLVTHYVNLIEEGNHAVPIDRKLVAYTWFRLYALTLCKNVQIEERKEPTDEKLVLQQNLIFNQMILNELKELRRLKQSLPADTEVEAQGDGAKCKLHSLENCSVGWFVYAVERLSKSERCGLSNFEIEQCANQWLTLLLQCVHLYEPARLVCATMDFVEELMFIYENSKNDATKLLALKILRDLFPHLPESANGSSRSMMKKRLHEFLFSIGENCNPCITTELIYIYRTIMKRRSAWQVMSIEMVFNGIVSVDMNIESLESLDIKQWNILIGSLCVLGGYIEPCGLGSVVKVFTDEEKCDFELGIVLDTNAKIDQFAENEQPSSTYLIQYLHGQVEGVVAEKLEVKIDVDPPTLPTLPSATDVNTAIVSLIDTFGKVLEFDISSDSPLRCLQLKRHVTATLYQILNQNQLIDGFMQKSYGSLIGQLAITDPIRDMNLKQANQLELNKSHLEYYSMILDQYQRSKQTIDDHEVSDSSSKASQSETSPMQYKGWTAFVTKAELEAYKIGRKGRDDIVVIPFPCFAADSDVVEACGFNHHFHGRIRLNDDNSHKDFPSFIVKDLELTEGNWYYCVRLLTGGLVQIGWVTQGFDPKAHSGTGVGDDQYSWSFDGSRGTVYYDQEFSYLPSNIRWKENDVCGCGIEINGENTRIKYWLNGKFLGTPFTHQGYIASTRNKCNLLPNGPNTTYTPGISLQGHFGQESCCEFIISPEDMAECPMPDGYKPLLMPRLIQGNIAYVAYPFSAYLVGDKSQDSLCRLRNVPSRTFLRDFINEKHIETTFTVNDMNQVELTENSSGFPFSIDDELSSLTISFDLQLLKTDEATSEIISDIQLCTIETNEIYPIKISLDDINDKLTRVVMLVSSDKQQIKVYINNDVQMVDCEFQLPTVFNFHFLPNVSAALKNFALWKYELSEEHVSRLMKNGLSYVVDDYDALNEHRLQANTFTFKKDQQCFLNEYLVLMNRPFDEMNWKETQQECQCDESKYFKNIDDTNESVLQLMGNKSYLVVKKSADLWKEYIIIMDIMIPSFPSLGQQMTLVRLNEQTNLYLKPEGALCLSINDDGTSSIFKVPLNEPFRLLIKVDDESVYVYIDGALATDYSGAEGNELSLSRNQIFLFREIDPKKYPIEKNKVRVECKSLTFIKQRSLSFTMDESFKGVKYSLDKFVAMPINRISTSLINIGYKPHWIKKIVDEEKVTHIQTVDTMIRENLEDFQKADVELHEKYILHVLSTLSPLIDREKLKSLIATVTEGTEDEVKIITELVLTQWDDLKASKPDADATQLVDDESHSDTDTDSESTKSSTDELSLHEYLINWVEDKLSNTIDDRNAYHLLDHKKFDEKLHSDGLFSPKNTVKQFAQYSNTNISSDEYVSSRVACENGLISIYARYAILNMLKVWTSSCARPFPLTNFGDYLFIIKLLRTINYTNTYFDSNFDALPSLIKPILRNEMKQLVDLVDDSPEIVPDKAPLLYHLHRDIITECIRTVLNASILISENEDKDSDLQEPIKVDESNLSFIMKILNIFVDLVTEKSTIAQNKIDHIFSLIFSEPLANSMYDLFLILPTSESKIFILQLFISLMQTNRKFNLNDSIKKSLSEMLTTLLSTKKSKNNHLNKSFQIVVIDLVHLILTNQKTENPDSEHDEGHFELQLTKLPQTFQNLKMLFHVIEAVIDETKQTDFPKEFFTKASEVLDSSLSLSLEETKTANNQFDKKSDLELVTLMNDDALIEDSFSEFINSLSTTYTSADLAIFEKYPTLLKISVEYIKARAMLFYVIENLVAQILPIVDFNLLPGKSIFTDKVRQIKDYLSRRKRHEWFEESLQDTKANIYSLSSIDFDLIKASNASTNAEHTIFYQGFEQLYEKAHQIFRVESARLWEARLVGMNSIDQGGPYRDSITLMCSDICSNRLSLFILCPNGRTNAGLNCDRWIPNTFPPGQAIPLKIRKQYRFVGQLMGMAIRKKHYLDLKFPELLWKQLLGEPITIKDIEAIDLQSCALIREMENEIEGRSSTENSTDTNYLFTSVMSELRFEIVSSAGHTYELIPGGADIPITAENIKEYCSRYREYRLNEFRRQIEYIGQGLCSVVPSDFLSLLTVRELEELVCGKGEIDVELLKRNTNYDGADATSPYIERFWKVFGEMLDNEQRKLFLKFVWGRNTLPANDEDFTDKFRITLIERNQSEVDSWLPSSHTCSFALDLPAYSTTEIMYARLSYAMNYCSAIDADG